MHRRSGLPCPQVTTRNGVHSSHAVGTSPTKPCRKKQQQQGSQVPQRQQHNSSRVTFSEDKMRQRRTFLTNYCGLLKKAPPPIPPSLIKGLTSNENGAGRRKDHPGLGKVKIMLRITGDEKDSGRNSPNDEFLRVEGNRKHVSVFSPPDPATGGRSGNLAAAKVYAFDSVFTHETTQSEICSASLVDVIQAVLNGADGTVFCYGQASLGKTFVLSGSDNKSQDLGVIPCAISWLFRCVRELQEQQGNRFSVSLSAIEVYGTSEKLRDLLAAYSNDPPPAPLTITEDALMGTQIENRCEIRANTSERAAYLLDAALASRSCSGSRNTAEGRRHSHVVFTINLTQYKADKHGDGSTVRSRLHFIDLGSCEKNLIKTPGSLALSFSSLGHVIMAIVNNSKHVPFRQSKLTCVLRDALGNINCRAVMLAHVSRDVTHFADTMATIQLASRIHRVVRKKNKGPSGNGTSAIGVGTRIHHPKHMRHRTRDEDSLIGSSSGMECTSGSELSCDTVIYVNGNGVPMSDRELTDNEGPPESVPISKPPVPLPRQHQASLASPTAGEVLRYNIPEARVKPIQRLHQPSGAKAASKIPSPGVGQHSVEHPKSHRGSKTANGVGRAGGSPKPTKPPRSGKNAPSNVGDTQKNGPEARRATKCDNVTDRSISHPRSRDTDYSLVNHCPRPGSNEDKSPRVYDHASSLDDVFHCDEEKNKIVVNHCIADVQLNENYPRAGDRRQEPDGCDNDVNRERKKSAAKAHHQYVNMQVAMNQKMDVRPDSMLVNVDDGDWRGAGNDAGDPVPEADSDGDDAVDINFYCLTLTSLNPLVPVSRRKFAQEVKHTKRQRGTVEQQRALARQNLQEGMQMEGADNETTREALRKLLEAEKTLEELVLDASNVNGSRDESAPRNNNVWAWKVEDCNRGAGFSPNGGFSPIEDGEPIVDDNIAQMPTLNCDYYSRDDSVSTESVESPQSLTDASASAAFSNASEPAHRHVCLYATNSLEMNYVSTQYRSESPPRSRQESPCPSKKLVVKDSELRRRTSRPVIITKSTSEEGAHLTLVKKGKGDSRPTLELQITREEVQDEVDLTTTKLKKPRHINRGRVNGISADPNSHGSEKVPAKLGVEGQKRSKWSGLRRFSSKRSESKSRRDSGDVTASPSRSNSIVSKLLTPKVKRASSTKQAKRGDGGNADSPRRQPDVVMVGNSPAHSKGSGSDEKIETANGHAKTSALHETVESHPKSCHGNTPIKAPASASVTRKKSGASPSVSRFGFSRKSKVKT